MLTLDENNCLTIWCYYHLSASLKLSV